MILAANRESIWLYLVRFLLDGNDVSLQLVLIFNPSLLLEKCQLVATQVVETLIKRDVGFVAVGHGESFERRRLIQFNLLNSQAISHDHWPIVFYNLVMLHHSKKYTLSPISGLSTFLTPATTLTEPFSKTWPSHNSAQLSGE